MQVFRSLGHVAFVSFHVRYNGCADGKDVLLLLAHALAADALAQSYPFVAGWHERLNLAFVFRFFSQLVLEALLYSFLCQKT